MTSEIKPWEIKLRVYETGRVGREAPTVSYNGEFDLRGVLKGLREEEYSKISTEDWIEMKAKLYKTFFEKFGPVVESYSTTLFGENSIWEISVSPLNGIPEYSFGQGSVYIRMSPENSKRKEDEVKHLLSTAITATIRDCLRELGIKTSAKSKRNPIVEYF